MSKDTLTAAQWRQMNSKQPKKSTTEKKVQSGKEMMDISSSPIERIIDGLVCKVGQIVNYDKLHIEVTLDGEEYKITVQKV